MIQSMRRWVFLLAALTGSASLASEQQDDSPALRYLLAGTLRAEGDAAAALAELERAVAAAPTEPYLELELARYLLELGRLDEASQAASRALLAMPGEPDALRLRGRIEMARSERDPAALGAARAAFEELRKRSPDDVELLVSLAQIYLAGGQARLATELLDEAVRLRPGNGWIESLRSRALGAGGDTAAAEEIQRELLRRDAANLAARFELVERLARRGENAEAVAILEESPAAQRERVDVRERLARQLFLAGDAERALPLAEGVVSERPDLVSGRLLLARIGAALGRFAEAESVLEPLAPRAAEEAQIAELLVRIREGRGDYRGAAQVLEERRDGYERAGQASLAAATALDLARLALRAGENAEGARLARQLAEASDQRIAEAGLRLAARALVAEGRVEEALELASETDPLRSELATLKLDLLLAARRFDDAALEQKRLLGAMPSGELAVGATLHEWGRCAAAAPLLEVARQEFPDSIEATFRLASCYERLGRVDAAVALFRELVSRVPRLAPALNYLGYVWIERSENLEEAVGLVREAVRIEPDNGAYVDSLGWGYFKLGAFDNAVRYLERAARLLPSDATIQEHLGDARAAQGDADGARSAYRRAMELGHAEAEELSRKLANLSGES